MSIRILEDRFELKEELSRTDVTTVYLGCDRQHFDRPQCVVTGIHYRQATMRHRLEREAQVLERLGRSPQVPRLLAYSHEALHETPDEAPGETPHETPRETAEQSASLDGQPPDNRPKNVFYVVQEHLIGHPISHEIAQGKHLSESYVNKLLQDVLVALSFIHNQGIVHQNLHPEHLIRQDFDGQVFLTQFGSLSRLARSEIDESGNLHIVQPVIPHPYLAPEQLKPDYERTPQPASDLYALGLIAIEALTGQPHYHFSYDPHLGLRWREDIDVSLPLAEFIDRLVRQDWRDRFSDAQAALDMIRLVSDRFQVAHNSRIPTMLAAPGGRVQVRSHSGGSSGFRTSFARPHITRSSTAYPRQSRAATPTNPYLLKIFIGSLAVIIALGVGVKAYQWGQHRLTQIPQSWEDWKTPESTYEEAKRSDLTEVLDDGSILLRPAAATAFWNMVLAASDDGVTLHPLAGYRSLSDLEADAKDKDGVGASAEFETSVATLQNDYATGYALDIGGAEARTDWSFEFAQTDAYRWLDSNAQSYGFELSRSGDGEAADAATEPWHWRYVDNEHSQKVFKPNALSSVPSYSSSYSSYPTYGSEQEAEPVSEPVSEPASP
ncbi:MAG: D-alanyl-D-alanine carboxypeptidase family protein [Cyanobacteria bacterium J06627_28]